MGELVGALKAAQLAERLNQSRLLDGDSGRPVLALGSSLFLCRWERVFGTHLLFQVSSLRPQVVLGPLCWDDAVRGEFPGGRTGPDGVSSAGRLGPETRL